MPVCSPVHLSPGLLLLYPALQGMIPPNCPSQGPLPPASGYHQSTGGSGETEEEAAGESFPTLRLSSASYRPGSLRQLPPWTGFQSSSAKTGSFYCPPALGRAVDNIPKIKLHLMNTMMDVLFFSLDPD